MQSESNTKLITKLIQISSNITWIITWIITIQVVPVRTTFVTCLPGALVLPGSGSGDARVHQWVWGSPSYWRFWPGFLWVFYDFLMFCLGCLGVLQYWIKWIKVDFCLFRLCAAFSGAALWKFMETVTHVQRIFPLFISFPFLVCHGNPWQPPPHGQNVARMPPAACMTVCQSLVKLYNVATCSNYSIYIV